MAQVDFSNAVLDIRTDITSNNPMANSAYLLFNKVATLYDENANWVVTNHSKSVLSNTPTKVSIMFTGTFTTSGTEFYMGDGNSNPATRPWKVSNISFSNGDTYAFVIDIEVSGNT